MRSRRSVPSDADSDAFTAGSGLDGSSALGKGEDEAGAKPLRSFVWDSGKGQVLASDPDGVKANKALRLAREAARATMAARASAGGAGVGGAARGAYAGGTGGSTAPQLQVVGGEIVIAEESLVYRAGGSSAPPDTSTMATITEAGDASGTTNSSFAARARARVWTLADTRRFYDALMSVGADFTMLQRYFPGRTRKQLKHKFRQEERRFPQLVDAAMLCRTGFTTALDSANITAGEEALKRRVAAKLNVAVQDPAVQEALEREKRLVLQADMWTDTRPPQDGEGDAAAAAAANVAALIGDSDEEGGGADAPVAEGSASQATVPESATQPSQATQASTAPPPDAPSLSRASSAASSAQVSFLGDDSDDSDDSDGADSDEGAAAALLPSAQQETG